MNKVEAPKPVEYVCDRKGKPRKNGTVRKSICPHQNRLCCMGGGGAVRSSLNGVSSLLVYAGQNSHPEGQSVRVKLGASRKFQSTPKKWEICSSCFLSLDSSPRRHFNFH